METDRPLDPETVRAGAYCALWSWFVNERGGERIGEPSIPSRGGHRAWEFYGMTAPRDR